MVWLLLIASGLWLRWLTLQYGESIAWPSLAAAILLGLLLAHVALGNWLLAFQRINAFFRLAIAAALAGLATANSISMLPGSWPSHFWMWLVFGLTVLAASWFLQAVFRSILPRRDAESQVQFGLLDALVLMTSCGLLMALPRYIPTSTTMILTTWRFFFVPLVMAVGLNLCHSRRLHWLWPGLIIGLALVAQTAFGLLQINSRYEALLLTGTVGTAGVTLVAGHAFQTWSRRSRIRRSPRLKVASAAHSDSIH